MSYKNTKFTNSWLELYEIQKSQKLMWQVRQEKRKETYRCKEELRKILTTIIRCCEQDKKKVTRWIKEKTSIDFVLPGPSQETGKNPGSCVEICRSCCFSFNLGQVFKDSFPLTLKILILTLKMIFLLFSHILLEPGYLLNIYLKIYWLKIMSTKNGT